MFVLFSPLFYSQFSVLISSIFLFFLCLWPPTLQRKIWKHKLLPLHAQLQINSCNQTNNLTELKTIHFKASYLQLYTKEIGVESLIAFVIFTSSIDKCFISFIVKVRVLRDRWSGEKYSGKWLAQAEWAMGGPGPLTWSTGWIGSQFLSLSTTNISRCLISQATSKIFSIPQAEEIIGQTLTGLGTDSGHAEIWPFIKSVTSQNSPVPGSHPITSDQDDAQPITIELAAVTPPWASSSSSTTTITRAVSQAALHCSHRDYLSWERSGVE